MHRLRKNDHLNAMPAHKHADSHFFSNPFISTFIEITP